MGPFSATARRLTGAFGIVFVVALAASIITASGPPGSDSTGAQVELFAIHHYHALQASLVLGLVAALFYSLFIGGLATLLHRADQATGDMWAPAFVVGAAGVVILSVAAEALQGAYQELSHSSSLPEQVLELFRVSNGAAAGAGLFLAVVLVTIGASGLLNGTIPVPLAWFGLLDAVLALAGAGGIGTARSTFGTLGTLALVAFGAWSLGVSLWLILSPAAEGPEDRTDADTGSALTA